MLEATPIVVDGVMYTTQPGEVVALDARTGRQIWRYARPQKVRNPYEINPFNRGVAILGNRLFVGTLDAALVALDARTGLPLWETQVADTMLGYSLTSAPLVVKDKVLVGITGGEFGARGFLDAYDAATGKQLWRWYSVPGPGEFGNDTWPGDSWKLGGSPMWLTGSYDPELNTVYWTVGNPGPQIDRSVRGDLDNLFSDSVVALDPDTGQRKWHYQFTPNDGHDWDSAQDRDARRSGLARPDAQAAAARRSQRLLLRARSHERQVSVRHAVRLHELERRLRRERTAERTSPDRTRAADGSFFVYPTRRRRHELPGAVVQPVTGWMYLEYSENGQQYISTPVTYEAGRQYIGRTNAAGAPASPKPGEPAASAGIKALDPETGKTMWDFKIFQGSLTNGVLATAGNVLFGAIRDGNLVALDAQDRKASLALPDRRQHGGLADQLRGERPAVRRDRRRQHGVRVRAAGSASDDVAHPHRERRVSSRARCHRVVLCGATATAWAQPYSARRTGDVVQLEDARSQTIVSILPSVGNIAFAMKVKGHDVLRWPYASVEEFKARPALSGIPFVGPWANRLDEQAFYANGKRYPFDMDLGNVRGAIPIHGFLTTTDRVAGDRGQGGRRRRPGSRAGSSSSGSRRG